MQARWLAPLVARARQRSRGVCASAGAVGITDTVAVKQAAVKSREIKRMLMSPVCMGKNSRLSKPWRGSYDGILGHGLGAVVTQGGYGLKGDCGRIALY